MANHFLSTRSYVVGYEFLLPPLIALFFSFFFPFLLCFHDEKHWSVFRRRIKTPLDDYNQSRAIAPLIWLYYATLLNTFTSDVNINADSVQQQLAQPGRCRDLQGRQRRP